MDTEKINKIYELSKKKENLEKLLKGINNNKTSLVDRYLSPNNACTAQPYLEELMKRFVTMVLVDISDIETELESL